MLILEINDVLCSWFFICRIGNVGKDMVLGDCIYICDLELKLIFRK